MKSKKTDEYSSHSEWSKNIIIIFFFYPQKTDLSSTRGSFRQNNTLVDGNDKLFLVYHNSAYHYYLYMKTSCFNQQNSSLFVHNMQRRGERRELLRYNSGITKNELNLNDYMSDDKYVLFEIAMKQ